MSDERKEAGFKDADKQIKIYYTPEAYIKLIRLVKAHDTEIRPTRVEPDSGLDKRRGMGIYQRIQYPVLQTIRQGL